MERRKVLAAVAAAISAPELSAWDFDKKEARPDSPEVAAVRKWAIDRIIERLWGINSPGPATLIDACLLAEALDRYNPEKRDEFCGLLNAFLEVAEADKRYVVVPPDLHEHVDGFNEGLKGSGDMVLRCPPPIREQVAEVIRFLSRNADGEGHVTLERGENEEVKYIHVEPWKDAPTGDAA